MKNRTILYIEDDDNIRNGTANYLRKLYSKVKAVDNCEEALDLYEDGGIDIIITDIYIDAPNAMDGLDMIKLIRKKDIKTPILITTAYSEKQNLLRAVELHLDGFLVKVFSRMELKDKLSKIDKRLDNQNLIDISDTIIYDPSNLIIAKKDIKIELTHSENRLFHLLSKSKNSLVHFDTINNEFYNSDKDNGIALRALIFSLRKKLKENRINEISIKSVSKEGYKLLC